MKEHSDQVPSLKFQVSSSKSQVPSLKFQVTPLLTPPPLPHPLHLKRALVLAALIAGVEIIPFDRAGIGVVTASPAWQVMLSGECPGTLATLHPVIRAVGTADQTGPGGVVVKLAIALRIFRRSDHTAQIAMVPAGRAEPGALPGPLNTRLRPGFQGGLPFLLEGAGAGGQQAGDDE